MSGKGDFLLHLECNLCSSNWGTGYVDVNPSILEAGKVSRLPSTLGQAVKALEADKVLWEHLGTPLVTAISAIRKVGAANDFFFSIQVGLVVRKMTHYRKCIILLVSWHFTPSCQFQSVLNDISFCSMDSWIESVLRGCITKPSIMLPVMCIGWGWILQRCTRFRGISGWAVLETCIAQAKGMVQCHGIS